MRNNKGQFVKGITTWNKGKKGIRLSPKSEFKVGEKVGENHPSWKGGIQKISKDCAYLWDGANKRKRRPKAIWEQNNGTLPEGMIIYHINGDKDDDDISNLKAITRAELLRLNQINKIKKYDKKISNKSC